MPKEVFKGRDHKERTQPKARKRLGFLEKHKDYVKRAREYHRKEDVVKGFQREAAFKNPDEFAFGMHKVRVGEKGQHVKLASTTPNIAVKKSGNRRNRTYLQMQHKIDKQNIERLQGTLANLDEAGLHNDHIVFAEDEDEAEEVMQKHKKRKLGVETKVPRSKRDPHVELRLRKAKAKQYNELEARQKRIEHVDKLLKYLDFEKKKMMPGMKKVVKLKDGTKQVKFKPERQK
uniref:U3 small nucleolar RNA-associated protein 11 n=1 Tax=Eutreptiella gymnastica TaxID=73025 RepID=A0A7S1J8J9_9EUGL